MSLPDFQVLRPRTNAEAVELLARHAGDIRIIAGGTDLVPSMRQKLFTPKFVLDIRAIAELNGIRESAAGLSIGAMTTLAAIERHPAIRKNYSVLREATITVASPVIRNMATLGGNICLDTRCLWYNQSLAWRKSCGFCIKKDGNLCHVAPGGTKCWAAFSADTPPALLCLGAQLEILSPQGVRIVPLQDLYSGAGEAPLKLASTDLLAAIHLPAASSGLHGAYKKLRIRGSIDYPLAGVAVTFRNGAGNPTANSIMKDVRVAITAVNPAPLLVREAAKQLEGKPFGEATAELAGELAGELAAKSARPLTTSALTPEYRKEMVRVLAKRALLSLA
ncbi:MAG: FAD binding domain-containing protein [Acidobacteriia bacterium]|nr:FAD binding domain-containing protein [Terriglobia bacterium]